MLSLKLFLFEIFSAGFFFLCYCLYAQTAPDSLIVKLNNTKDDSIRVRTLLDIGEAMEATAISASLSYYQQAYIGAQKIKNKRLMLSSLNDFGIAYIESNKFDSAILNLEKALGVANEIGDTLRAARITTNIGNVYLDQNNRLKALEYYLYSAKVWERASDQRGLASLYSNISSLLTHQEEYAKALEYGNKGFLLAS